MVEVLKTLKIYPKVLARRTNALWDILLPTEQDAKQLAGNVLVSKNLKLQTEYLGTRRTKITIHCVPIDISEDWMGAFFAKFGKVEEVKALVDKSGILTGDVEVQVTLDRNSFKQIPNTFACRERKMWIVVEGRKPSCWVCDVVGHIAKDCPAKRPLPVTQPTPIPEAAVVVAVTEKRGSRQKSRW